MKLFTLNLFLILLISVPDLLAQDYEESPGETLANLESQDDESLEALQRAIAHKLSKSGNSEDRGDMEETQALVQMILDARENMNNGDDDYSLDDTEASGDSDWAPDSPLNFGGVNSDR